MSTICSPLPLTRRTVMSLVSVGGLGLALRALSADAQAQSASPVPPPEIPHVVQSWVDAWNAQDPTTLLALYASDATFEEVPFADIHHGIDQISKAVGGDFRTFTNFRYEIVSAFQAGSMAAAEVTVTAGYSRSIPDGPPARGQPVTLRMTVIFEIDGERIRSQRNYYDAYTFLLQLGALGDATPIAIDTSPEG